MSCRPHSICLLSFSNMCPTRCRRKSESQPDDLIWIFSRNRWDCRCSASKFAGPSVHQPHQLYNNMETFDHRHIQMSIIRLSLLPKMMTATISYYRRNVMPSIWCRAVYRPLYPANELRSNEIFFSIKTFEYSQCCYLMSINGIVYNSPAHTGRVEW